MQVAFEKLKAKTEQMKKDNDSLTFELTSLKEQV